MTQSLTAIDVHVSGMWGMCAVRQQQNLAMFHPCEFDSLKQVAAQVHVVLCVHNVQHCQQGMLCLYHSAITATPIHEQHLGMRTILLTEQKMFFILAMPSSCLPFFPAHHLAVVMPLLLLHHASLQTCKMCDQAQDATR